jgi:hypothetical protein
MLILPVVYLTTTGILIYMLLNEKPYLGRVSCFLAGLCGIITYLFM